MFRFLVKIKISSTGNHPLDQLNISPIRCAPQRSTSIVISYVNIDTGIQQENLHDFKIYMPTTKEKRSGSTFVHMIDIDLRMCQKKRDDFMSISTASKLKGCPTIPIKSLIDIPSWIVIEELLDGFDVTRDIRVIKFG